MAIVAELVNLTPLKEPPILSKEDKEVVQLAEAMWAVAIARPHALRAGDVAEVHNRIQPMRLRCTLSGQGVGVLGVRGFAFYDKTRALFDPAAPELQRKRSGRVSLDYQDVQAKPKHYEPFLGLASAAPRAQLDVLRAIAESLQFAIFPTGALRSKEPLGSFVNLDAYFDTYVLAPLSMLNVQAFVDSQAQVTIYCPAFSQAAMVLSMSIPMWRSVAGDVGALRAEVERLQVRMDAIEKRVEEIQRSVQEQQRQIAAIQAQAARERVAAHSELRGLEAQVFTEDPLAFAVPKGTDIFAGNPLAILGPCWGGDIPDAMLSVIGLSPNAEQRNLFKTTPWGKKSDR